MEFGAELYDFVEQVGYRSDLAFCCFISPFDEFFIIDLTNHGRQIFLYYDIVCAHFISLCSSFTICGVDLNSFLLGIW